MITTDLIDYIRRQFAAGVSKDDVAKALIAQGWQVIDINNAFSIVSGTSTMSTYQSITQPSSLPPVGAAVQTPPSIPSEMHARRFSSATVFGVLIVLLAAGVGAYGFIQQISPFALIALPESTKNNTAPAPVASQPTTQESASSATSTPVYSDAERLALIKSDFTKIQTQAGMYYSKKGSSYGTQKWNTGAAASCTGGMFSDPAVSTLLAHIDEVNGSAKNVACYAGGTEGYIVAAGLPSGWWCVDSTGISQSLSGNLPNAIPPFNLCPLR